MAKVSTSIRVAVERVMVEVMAGRYSVAAPWGGADIVLLARPRNRRTTDPDKRYVVTEFAGELSWLFERLRDVFAKAIDYQNKYEFYARLADAADRYLSTGRRSSHSAKGLLQAVAAEAWLMADEIRK